MKSKPIFTGPSYASQHPVHLFQPNGRPSPSALIPFCAYATDMSLVGVKTEDFSFPVCSSFTPTLHRGKVCYALTDKGLQSQKGMKGGLMLMIDNNYERSVGSPMLYKEEETDKSHIINFDQSSRGDSAEIYLHTLTPHSVCRPGRHIMTSVKKMTGTKGFLDFPDDIKECQNWNFEECQSRSVLQNAVEICGCLPWSLKYGILSDEV